MTPTPKFSAPAGAASAGALPTGATLGEKALTAMAERVARQASLVTKAEALADEVLGRLRRAEKEAKAKESGANVGPEPEGEDVTDAMSPGEQD